MVRYAFTNDVLKVATTNVDGCKCLPRYYDPKTDQKSSKIFVQSFNKYKEKKMGMRLEFFTAPERQVS